MPGLVFLTKTLKMYIGVPVRSSPIFGLFPRFLKKQSALSDDLFLVQEHERQRERYYRHAHAELGESAGDHNVHRDCVNDGPLGRRWRWERGRLQNGTFLSPARPGPELCQGRLRVNVQILCVFDPNSLWSSMESTWRNLPSPSCAAIGPQSCA